MTRIDVRTFDYENRKGEEIWCVELVRNDRDETGVETYECENEQDAIQNCERLNKSNTDSAYKYIAIKYTVQEDCLMC